MQSKFAKAKKLSEIQVKDYDAIFYVGGHGPVIDLASDSVNAKLASEVKLLMSKTAYVIFNFISSGKVVGSYQLSAMGHRKINSPTLPYNNLTLDAALWLEQLMSTANLYFWANPPPVSLTRKKRSSKRSK